MKKLLALLSALFFTCPVSFAEQEFRYYLNQSSITNSAELSYIPGTQMADILFSVTVGSCAAVGSNITVYDSSGTLTNPITPTIDTSSNTVFLTTTTNNLSYMPRACQQTYMFSIPISSGITYNKIGTASVGLYFKRRSKINLTYP